MFDDLKGLKKRFKLKMTVTRENLFDYMYRHGYDRISTVKKRVWYLLDMEELLDKTPNFMEKNNLTKGMIEQYEVVYRELYYNGEEHVIVLLGRPSSDGSRDCDIIKIKCEPGTSRVTTSYDLDGSVWITSAETDTSRVTDMSNMFLNYSIPRFDRGTLRLWTTTNDYGTRNDD